jgi:hypothetical protein
MVPRLRFDRNSELSQRALLVARNDRDIHFDARQMFDTLFPVAPVVAARYTCFVNESLVTVSRCGHRRLRGVRNRLCR